MKKTILSISLCAALVSLSANAAETCPSLADIKAGNFHSWLPLNTNSDNPASQDQIDNFENTAYEFYLAEWSTEYSVPINAYGRCYYDSGAEVYLAKGVSKPIIGTGNWQENSNVWGCYSTVLGSCVFG